MKNKFIRFLLLSLLASMAYAQQPSLQDLLWKQVGGTPADIEYYGGETKIIDEADNGFLQIETIEEGCGCYFKTAVGAYKRADDKYTFLKMEEDACNWRKNLSASTKLIPVLPKKFELPEFLSDKAKEDYRNNNAFPVFYLEATIPRKGTDTKLDLAYIPYGVRLSNRNDVLALTGYSELNNEGESDYTYKGDLKQFLIAVKDEKTVQTILGGKFDNINSVDYDLIEKICGKDKPYDSVENLAKDIRDLQIIYQFSKQIAFSSIVLGWDAQSARFYIKEKIKKDTSELSFLEFIQQLPFLVAIC